MRTPVDSFSTVPTAAERMGDFSADNVQLYNPLSNPTGPRSLITNTGCIEDQANAPGTCIPQSMISQTSLNLLQYIPLPNLPGQTLNFHLQTNLPGLNNRFTTNITHKLSSKLSLQANYNLSNTIAHTLSSFPNIEGDASSRGQAATLGLTQNYSKTFLNTTQLYFSRNRVLGLNAFSYVIPISQQLGIEGVSPAPFDYGLPQINLTNFTGLSNPNPSLNRSQTYRLVDTVKWLIPKHSVTIGGEVRRMDIDKDSDPAPNGLFNFTGLMTSQLTATDTPVASAAGCGPANLEVPCIGNDFADFLLGYPANTKVQFGDTSTYFRNWGYVGYVTDDWHMFPRFTVTYGVRYEAFTPATELNNRIVNLDVSPGFSEVQCVTPVPAGNCAASPYQSLIRGNYNNWAPRLGLAWQPPGKWFTGKHQTTIRAGYSMFYVESYLNTLASAMANQPPFATATTLTTLFGNHADAPDAAERLSDRYSFLKHVDEHGSGESGLPRTLRDDLEYLDRDHALRQHLHGNYVFRYAWSSSRSTSWLQPHQLRAGQYNPECGGIYIRYLGRILHSQYVASATAETLQPWHHVHQPVYVFKIAR